MSESPAGSPLKFDFFANPRVLFGWGRRTEAGQLADAWQTGLLGDRLEGPRATRHDRRNCRDDSRRPTSKPFRWPPSRASRKLPTSTRRSNHCSPISRGQATWSSRSVEGRPSTWRRPWPPWRPTGKGPASPIFWKESAMDCRSIIRRFRCWPCRQPQARAAKRPRTPSFHAAIRPTKRASAAN